MRSQNNDQKLLQQPVLQIAQPAYSSSISDLAARNVFVGLGAASILYPLDIVMHKLYSKGVSPSPSVIPSSTKPCRMALMAAAWTSYKYAVTGATMKITTKQQSQGAKSYLFDEKLTSMEEGIEPIDVISESLESKMLKSSGLRNSTMAVAASIVFGGAEAFITQTNSNNSTLSKEQLFAKKQGRVFELPIIKTWNNRTPTFLAGLSTRSVKSSFQFTTLIATDAMRNLKSSMRYRLAGLPIRAAKSSFQVGAFMATDAMEKYLLAKGYDKNTAKLGSIGSVSSTFGLVINACSLVYTQQIISINHNTISVDSIRNVASNIVKHSGTRGLLVGAGTSILYTAVVQTIVPPIEALAEEAVIPRKRELQSNVSSVVKTRLGLFTPSDTTTSTGLSHIERLDKLAEQVDQESQSNPFKRPGMD